ncbi:MAG TPA: putative toxin-antitoxin system toxin component, PIN family [Acidobacteriaceae bacterium]|nr:putative toxin-antitoxin system toxin component, PIN family [Acidobacteriaceae bacterium]
MIRVVPDTNIYISALIFGGLPGTFLDLALAGAFRIVTSEAILSELDEKLRGKFAVTASDAAAIRSKLERSADLVEPDFTLDAVPYDPDDNRILECAVAGGADCMVSGDRHLLHLTAHAGIPIMTVRQFVHAMGLRTDPITGY